MSQVPLSVGETAPDFRLQDQHGRDVALSDWAGQKAVLLVFYPFAFSGVCTGELVGLRDRLGDIETAESKLVAGRGIPHPSQRAMEACD